MNVSGYQHTHSFDRNGCIIGARFVSYSELQQWYVCRECGGKPVHHIGREDEQTVDWAECADCGARDFISLRLYQKQLADVPRIIEMLPEKLRALFPEKEELDITAQEAIDQLFD